MTMTTNIITVLLFINYCSYCIANGNNEYAFSSEPNWFFGILWILLILGCICFAINCANNSTSSQVVPV